MAYDNLIGALKGIGMDAAWEETKHHRADNGRFTSGSSRGKSASVEEKDSGAKGKKGDGDGEGLKEMSQDAAEKHVRAAFKACKCELTSLKMSGRSLNAGVKEADKGTLDAVNEHLGKNGLKAKILNKTTFKIAEDGADDAEGYASDPMFAVLVGMCAVEMAAKDLHYRAKGRSFYGMHELADLVKGIADGADDLNEVYFMGERGTEPPERSVVAALAAKKVGENPGEEMELIRLLQALCEDLIDTIEDAKEDAPLSGTSAVVDDISRKALQAVGLLRRITADEDKHLDRQNKIDSFIKKGVMIAQPGSDVPERGQDALTLKPDAVGRPCLATK